MDADYAHETAEMTKLQVMQQAGVAALAQARSMNTAVVSLLS
jgi:flagellin